VVKLPKGEGAGTPVAEPVQLSDLFATIASAAGSGTSPLRLGRRSLLDVASGRAEKAGTIYAETLYRGSTSVVRAPLPPRRAVAVHRSSGARALRLAKDPAENENLAAGCPRLPEPPIEMEKRRADFTAPKASTRRGAEARVLGYLTTGATTGADRSRPEGRDPPDRRLKTATGLFQNKRYPEAIAGFRRLLDRNPRMLDVWDL